MLATVLLAMALSIAPVMRSSFAQTIPQADPMRAGPLGEEAMGSDSAPVTIIEYASLTCPHCAHFAEETFPKLKKEYIDTGKVRYIFREFPFDPLAASGFMLARCAPKGDYFSVIGLLFRTQEQWAVPEPIGPLLSVARQAGFTKQSFKACLAKQKVLGGIEWVRDRAAKKFGVDATPTFFISGRKYVGDMSIAELDEAIHPSTGS
ncbi:MAG: DsbA family protein [Bradyrhizobium sp.]